jgi:20S proteasome subunit beta 1
LQLYSVQESKPPTVQTAASLFQQLCYSNKDRLMAGIIVAGVDPDGTPSVYAVPLGGSLHKKPFTIGGSGSTYIYGYCDAAYKEGMNKVEAIDFVKNGN